MKMVSIHDYIKFDEKRFTKIDMIKHRHSGVFTLNFLPGQTMKSHTHPGRELYLHVISGEGTFLFDGEEVPVKEGDVLYCDPEVMLGFNNTSKGNVSIYVTMTKINE